MLVKVKGRAFTATNARGDELLVEHENYDHWPSLCIGLIDRIRVMWIIRRGEGNSFGNGWGINFSDSEIHPGLEEVMLAFEKVVRQEVPVEWLIDELLDGPGRDLCPPAVMESLTVFCSR